MTTIDKFSSVESLLAANLDELADLAGFETPPAGSYILSTSFALKKVNDKDCVEQNCEVVETVELKNATDTAVPPGTKFSQLFMLDNEFGVGNMKTALKPFAAYFGTGNIGELLNEHLDEPVLIAAVLKIRTDKDDPDKKYARLTNVTVK